jgi:hypothetical protein
VPYGSNSSGLKVLPVSLSDVSSGEPGVSSSGSGVAVGVGLFRGCGAGPPPPRRPLPAGALLL